MFQFRLLCILFLGFSSGLPLALSGSTLQAWLTSTDVDIKTIGLYAAVGFPYTYKFLWSPLLDYINPRVFDHRRGWVFWMQIGCAGVLCWMAFIETHELWLLALAAASLAFCSATQDMAIDAYRADLLPASERGLGAAYYVTGYRIAMLVSGGLALILAGEWLGWRGTYLLMAGLLVISAVITAISPRVERDESVSARAQRSNIWKIVRSSARDFMTKDKAIWLLGLIILYKVGDAFAGSLTTAFLLKGLGFSLTEVGAVNKSVSLIATLLGTFIGGWAMIRIGLFASLMIFGLAQAISNLSFWALTLIDPSLLSMGVAIFIENLCGGMGTAAFIALLTAMCSVQFSATQYALLSSLASVGRVYLAAPAGYAVDAFGWGDFFIYSTIAAFPGLIALWLLRRPIQLLDHDPVDSKNNKETT